IQQLAIEAAAISDLLGQSVRSARYAIPEHPRHPSVEGEDVRLANLQARDFRIARHVTSMISMLCSAFRCSRFHLKIAVRVELFFFGSFTSSWIFLPLARSKYSKSSSMKPSCSLPTCR